LTGARRSSKLLADIFPNQLWLKGESFQAGGMFGMFFDNYTQAKKLGQITVR
jgi:hypothetical protein